MPEVKDITQFGKILQFAPWHEAEKLKLLLGQPGAQILIDEECRVMLTLIHITNDVWQAHIHIRAELSGMRLREVLEEMSREIHPDAHTLQFVVPKENKLLRIWLKRFLGATEALKTPARDHILFYTKEGKTW